MKIISIILFSFLFMFSLFANGQWSDSLLPKTPIKASHVLELRLHLHAKEACLLVPPSIFTDVALGLGTPIKAVHIEELRKKIDALGALWVVSDWSSCSGGSGAWSYSAWGTCAGGTTSYSYTGWSACSRNCGGGTQSRTSTCKFSMNTGTQSRTNTCVLNPNSGNQTRTVKCMKGGVTLPDSKCGTAKPVLAQFCTPTNTSLCGASGSLSQSCTPTGVASCAGTPIHTQSCNGQSCCTNYCFCSNSYCIGCPCGSGCGTCSTYTNGTCSNWMCESASCSYSCQDP